MITLGSKVRIVSDAHGGKFVGHIGIVDELKHNNRFIGLNNEPLWFWYADELEEVSNETTTKY